MIYREKFTTKEEALDREFELAHVGYDTDIYKESLEEWVVEWTEG